MEDTYAIPKNPVLDKVWAKRQLRIGVLCLLAVAAILLYLFLTGPVRPPYGRRPVISLFMLPFVGNSGAGPPRPIITRESDRLKFEGFGGSVESESSLAVYCSWQRPRGYGLTVPWVYKYEYGSIRWRDDLFPPDERAKLASEVTRIRAEIAAALPFRFRTPDTLPPGYAAAYATGPGVMTFYSVRGFFADVSCLTLPVLFVIGMTCTLRSWGVFRRLRAPTMPTCAECGYSLEGLLAGTCPECGSVIQAPTNTQSTRVDQPSG